MKEYWKAIELKGKEEASPYKKNPEDGDNSLFKLFGDLKNEGQASRRDFLKLCGYSFAIATLSSCHTKIRKAVPYVLAPFEITPGETNFYASSYINGSDYCSIIVKTREGRPIKIEGNPESGITKGGTSARVQASVLDLYDTTRYPGPFRDGDPLDWQQIDIEISAKLQKIVEKGGTTVLLTPSIFSPSTEAVITGFQQKFPGSEWVQYDAVSSSAIKEANKISFGKQVIPDYRFDKAELIVSFGADFLGTWLSPIEYTKQFSSGRDPDKKMNHLIQFESNLSLTGSNADKRIQIKPSQELAALLKIYTDIVQSVENRTIEVSNSNIEIGDVSKKLLESKGKSLVISSTNNKQIQLLINEINNLLGNIGHTILFDSYLRTHRGIDSDMDMLVEKMKKGGVDALLVWNVNPAYTYHNRAAFLEGIKRVGLSISLTGSPDETSQNCQYICPDNHYLESWIDAEPKKDIYSLGQPVINPIFDTRQMTDTLLNWSGSTIPFYDFINSYWAVNLMPLQSEFSDPTAFFDHTLQKGIFEPSPPPVTLKSDNEDTGNLPFDYTAIKVDNLTSKGISEIVLYESIALGEGRQANNPWLQELPDPVTRICWDNYASFSPGQAKELDLHDRDVIILNGVELPVHIQPGQCYGTIGIALGYGRSICGKVGVGIGMDVWPMLSAKDGNTALTREITEIIKTEKIYSFAQTQTHHSMEGRALVREAGLTEYKTDQTAGNEFHTDFLEHAESLYKEREYSHHHWGMAIDLTTCTGCANCVIACQAENNIPVVGKEEVHRVHEMHWLRIDRYYNGNEDNPEVVFQPVLCQHCDNAPCENVCPVAATNHSSEGLNQMVYNRCIGTRYCNNNCPYKVRRFNWFNYTEAGTLSGNLRDSEGMTVDLRRMVLNPDVTVRAQGVIEKCSFCVQRIQAAKLKAKEENRGLADGEMQTACSQTCPANAIVFGDMNDPKSEISRLMKSGRRYNLLEELFTKPSVNYLTKIRNITS